MAIGCASLPPQCFFLSPWVIGLIVFIGGPILFSVLFSFTRYDVLTPARYVGWDNFRKILWMTSSTKVSPTRRSCSSAFPWAW